jgi:hypothetical protein
MKKNMKKKGPDFIIIGPQKSGTTSLHCALLNHPQIVGPDEKELHFFSNDENFALGIESYHQSFPASQPEQIVFESTPNYFVSAVARYRLFEYNPMLKVIVGLRNPVHRFISQFYHFHAMALDHTHCKENGIITERWEGDPNSFEEILQQYSACRSDPLNYFTSGEYIVHLREWEELFGKQNVLCIDFDELASAPTVTLGRILHFVGVPQERLNCEHHNGKNS